MGRTSVAGALVLGLAWLVVAPAPALDGAERLDRFRGLVASRLGLAQGLDPARAEEVYRAIYALVDEEVVDNLAAGGLFASLAFLQDRLDGFARVWGGAAFRLGRAGQLTIGAFQLGEGLEGSSVRVYGRVGGEAALLSALSRPGHPVVYGLPPAGNAAQFLVAWEGLPSGRGTRALRLDLVRERGEDLEVVWTTADLFPHGLMSRAYQVGDGQVRIRYELHYPGWNPGCELQAEQEDVYRLAPGRGTFIRASRTRHHAWHLALHRAVDALLDALGSGDRAGLARLVPDPGLRERLPRTLERVAACDAPDGPSPTAVSVAATAEGRPWTLILEPAGGRWRLRAAGPVLE